MTKRAGVSQAALVVAAGRPTNGRSKVTSCVPRQRRGIADPLANSTPKKKLRAPAAPKRLRRPPLMSRDSAESAIDDDICPVCDSDCACGESSLRSRVNLKGRRGNRREPRRALKAADNRDPASPEVSQLRTVEGVGPVMLSTSTSMEQGRKASATLLSDVGKKPTEADETGGTRNTKGASRKRLPRMDPKARRKDCSLISTLQSFPEKPFETLMEVKKEALEESDLKVVRERRLLATDGIVNSRNKVAKSIQVAKLSVALPELDSKPLDNRLPPAPETSNHPNDNSPARDRVKRMSSPAAKHDSSDHAFVRQNAAPSISMTYSDTSTIPSVSSSSETSDDDDPDRLKSSIFVSMTGLHNHSDVKSSSDADFDSDISLSDLVSIQGLFSLAGFGIDEEECQDSLSGSSSDHNYSWSEDDEDDDEQFYGSSASGESTDTDEEMGSASRAAYVDSGLPSPSSGYLRRPSQAGCSGADRASVHSIFTFPTPFPSTTASPVRQPVPEKERLLVDANSSDNPPSPRLRRVSSCPQCSKKPRSRRAVRKGRWRVSNSKTGTSHTFDGNYRSAQDNSRNNCYEVERESSANTTAGWAGRFSGVDISEFHHDERLGLAVLNGAQLQSQVNLPSSHEHLQTGSQAISLDELLDVDLVCDPQEGISHSDNVENTQDPKFNHWERVPVGSFRKSRLPSAQHLPQLVTTGLKPSVREEPLWSATAEDLPKDDDDLSYFFRKAGRKFDPGYRRSPSPEMSSRRRSRGPDEVDDGESKSRSPVDRRRKRRLRTVGDAEGRSFPGLSLTISSDVAFACLPGGGDICADDGADILPSADEEFDVVLNMDIRHIDDDEDSEYATGNDSGDCNEECRCGRSGREVGDEYSSADEGMVSSGGSATLSGFKKRKDEVMTSGEDDRLSNAVGLPLFPLEDEADSARALLPLLSIPLFCPLPLSMAVIVPPDAVDVDITEAVVRIGGLPGRADDADNYCDSGDETCSEAPLSASAAAVDDVALQEGFQAIGHVAKEYLPPLDFAFAGATSLRPMGAGRF